MSTEFSEMRGIVGNKECHIGGVVAVEKSN